MNAIMLLTLHNVNPKVGETGFAAKDSEARRSVKTMTTPKDSFNLRSYGYDDFFVEAYARPDRPQRLRFAREKIVSRAEVDDNLSVLRLQDGMEIFVALPLDRLDALIYDTHIKQGPVIDLKPYTGGEALAASDVMVLRTHFGVGMQDLHELHVALWGFNKENASGTAVQALIPVSNIKKYEEDKTFKQPQNIGFISFKNAMILLPFPDHCFFHMNIEKFKEEIRQAQTAGETFLNLLGKTKPPAAAPVILQPFYRGGGNVTKI